MKFWSSGRIDIKVESNVFRPVMLEVDNSINEIVMGKYYGEEIVSYEILVNIFEREGSEIFKYNAKDKITDIDVNVNHDDFIDADFNGRCRLYISATLHSIDEMRKHKKLTSFDFSSFYSDVASLLNRYIV